MFIQNTNLHKNLYRYCRNKIIKINNDSQFNTTLNNKYSIDCYLYIIYGS